MILDQSGDVLLYQTTDDGEINIVNGVTEMTPGLGTAAYLSLFGGNEDDDGSADSPYSYWANLNETDPARQYRSETQHLLRSIPATSSNLRRIEQAALRDLAWFDAEISVAVSIPALNRIKMVVTINQNSYTFLENWRASA